VADPPPVPCLVGATGVGKSEVAVALARRVGGEVVSCDAMTAYRGLPLLTARPSPPHDVPHHLLDVVEPEEAYSAARFVEDADRVVADVRRRGRVPVLAGGTALYLRAFAKGLGPRVGRDEGLRARLAAVARERGPRALHALLAERDPARAREVHENDERRIVRALEIVEATGRPASAFRAEFAGPDRRPVAVVVLRRDPEDLRARIDARVAALPARGVLGEVASFLARHPGASPEARATLGLADLAAHLEGRLSLAEALERVARATRRFARRQDAWFRRLPGATLLEAGRDATPEALAEAAEEALQRAGALAGTSS
jgi:tRNA dimethylallyltransferase